jgi:glycolate oxidase
MPVTRDLLTNLATIVGPKHLRTLASELLVYECDGYTIEKNVPEVVVFPASTDELSRVMRACAVAGVPVVPRGAGTGLAGGCLPIGGGVMIATTRMTSIEEINLRDRYAVVEAGVVNIHLNRELAGSGYHYAPDPSSQSACTIGGNVATNSGGPHTLKYGVTVNHVLGVEMVLPDGSVETFGGPLGIGDPFDLTGLMVGSEGTLGICTRATVRLTRDPAAWRTLLAIFPTVADATAAISSIIGAGLIPAALELMDQGIIGAVEAAFHFGFPLDAGAVLIIELDGLEVAIEEEAARIVGLLALHNVRETRVAQSAAERAALWKCRKQSFGAIGRLSPSYCTQDGVVPRTRLPEILAFIQQTSEKHGIRIVNVCHAGDGNIHPVLLFDERREGELQRVLHASDEILGECIRLGGSITGEHGIGVEKRSFLPQLFTPEDVAVMSRLRETFNPTNLLSPGKMFPAGSGCGSEHIERAHPGKQASA